MRSDIALSRFVEIMGAQNAKAYISSIMLAVANSDKLQECTVESIYTSALRSATLRLSVDVATGQAYLVPFKGKATLIVGYKGLYDMAIRTGRYRYINVGPVYDGEEVFLDRITGFHSLGGHRKDDATIIGWIGAFQMNDGYSKTVYMTVEECHERAKKYSKNYNYADSRWKLDPKAMEQKTVMRLLLGKWGYLDPSDMQTLSFIEEDSETIDTEPVIHQEKNDEPKEKKPDAELLSELGYKTEVLIETETKAPPQEEKKKDDLPEDASDKDFPELIEVKEKIIVLCKKLGGSKNDELMKTIRDYEPTGDPRKISDFGMAEKLLEQLEKNKKENK